MSQEPIIPIITLEDVDNLLNKKKRTAKNSRRFFVKSLTLFLLFFILFFVLSNFPAIYKKVGYSFTSKEQPKPVDNNGDLTIINLPELNTTNLPDNRLIIEKINVDAPIIWNIKEEGIIDNLKQGVVHYDGSYLPDEQGNVFITGHSSNYFWDDGKYKEVFALLEKLEIGDEIKLTYQNRLYVYKVSEKKVVNPKQVEVVYGTNNRTLSLMTCVPVGTNLRRLIVKADFVYPGGDLKASNSLPVFLGN